MIGNGRIGVSELGTIFNSDFENELINQWKVFSISKRFTIPASPSVAWIVLDPTSFDLIELDLKLLTMSAQDAGPINVDVFSGTLANNDGTLWTGFNRNTIPTITQPKTIFRLNPTIINNGIDTGLQFIIRSNGIPATATAIGESNETSIIKLNPILKYALRFSNTEATTARGYFGARWYEI